MELLPYCLALGLGEGLAALMPTLAPLWPLFGVSALLAALIGYGGDRRGWPSAALFLAGAALFLQASVARETRFRETPWMREVRTAPTCESYAPAVRAELLRRLARGVSPRAEGVRLNRAILLGDRSALDRRVRRVFEVSGTVHVFAISGLHVMVVARVLVALMALLLVPRRWSGLAALPALWGYVAVIGAPPSAVRAALMASFYLSAPVFWRRSDALRAWSQTFLAVHLVSPSCIANVGSLLSFVVMLFLLLACRASADWPSPRARGLFVAFAAWGAGVPIAARLFGHVTPGGLVANLLLIPAATASVAAGAVGVAVSFVSETLAGYVNNLSVLFTDAMTCVAHVVARLPGADLPVEPWTALECLSWYLALAVFVCCANGRIPASYRKRASVP